MNEKSRAETTVAVDGRQILVDNEPTTLLGFRVPSAALQDDWTDELVAQLELWRAHGVNALTIWLQGSSGGYTPLFACDGGFNRDAMDIVARVDFNVQEMHAPIGQTTGSQVVTRAHRIIEAARRAGMVVVLGLFYRPAVARGFTADILRQAARTAAKEFGGYGNVVFNVFNEAVTRNSLESSESLAAYMRTVKATAPDRPVGTGSMRAEVTGALARLPELDIVLQDAGWNAEAAIAAFDMLCAIASKPVVNVESFLGSGNAYIDVEPGEPEAVPGYYLEFPGYRRVFGAWADEDGWSATQSYLAGRRSYLRLIDHVGRDATRQTHLLVHAAGWFQGASRVREPAQVGAAGFPGRWGNTCHVGHGQAAGTVKDPGIKWVLDRFKMIRSETRGA